MLNLQGHRFALIAEKNLLFSFSFQFASSYISERERVRAKMTVVINHALFSYRVEADPKKIWEGFSSWSKSRKKHCFSLILAFYAHMSIEESEWTCVIYSLTHSLILSLSLQVTFPGRFPEFEAFGWEKHEAEEKKKNSLARLFWEKLPVTLYCKTCPSRPPEAEMREKVS